MTPEEDLLKQRAGSTTWGGPGTKLNTKSGLSQLPGKSQFGPTVVPDTNLNPQSGLGGSGTTVNQHSGMGMQKVTPVTRPPAASMPFGMPGARGGFMAPRPAARTSVSPEQQEANSAARVPRPTSAMTPQIPAIERPQPTGTTPPPAGHIGLATAAPPPAPPTGSGVSSGIGAAVAKSITGASSPGEASEKMQSKGVAGQTGSQPKAPDATEQEEKKTAVQPSTRGFAAFARSKLAGANWRASTRDRQSGYVARSGAFKGMTRDVATEKIREQFAAMSPEEKAKWETFSDATGDQTKSPETNYREANPQPATNPEKEDSSFLTNTAEADIQRRQEQRRASGFDIEDDEEE